MGKRLLTGLDSCNAAMLRDTYIFLKSLLSWYATRNTASAIELLHALGLTQCAVFAIELQEIAHPAKCCYGQHHITIRAYQDVLDISAAS